MGSRKVLFVGQVGRGQTSGMRRDAIGRLGYVVAAVDSGDIWKGASYLERQREQLGGSGRRIDRFNEQVASAIAAEKPNLIWAEKQEHLDPELLRRARDSGIITVHYNPDPYFSLDWKRTASGDACLREYDVLVVTKRYELEEYRRIARGQVMYSPLGFDPLSHRPAPPRQQTMDVAFVGGWEPRRERLLADVSRSGATVAIWGYGWRVAQQHRMNPLRALRLGRLTPGRRMYWGASRDELVPAVMPGETAAGEIYGDAYPDAVAGSRIVLGLLREVCPDEHTTRTFEIPAMQGFMLADRSAEHLEFFEEGSEAAYFETDEEFFEKTSYYLKHEAERLRIAAAGRQRCLTSGYSYDERLRTVLHVVLPL